MSKYSKELKQEVVNAYLAGEGGYKSLAKRFGVVHHSSIARWVIVFNKSGEKGLAKKKIKPSYSVKFKLDVLNYRLRTGDSFQEVALKYDISGPSIIWTWSKKYHDEGLEGLSREKGRPSMSNKSKNKSTKNELTREEQLEKEIELLKAENAYLKKLRASGIDIPSRLLK